MRLIFFILTLIIIACSDRRVDPSVLNINFNDTIRRTEIRFLEKGDTLMEHQVITFHKTDIHIPMDSFYYEATPMRVEQNEEYRIYFDRRKVLVFCDSMLKVIGPETSDNFNDVNLYESILDHARNGFAEVMVFNEIHYLLNRFAPLIVNQKTGHKPSYYFRANRWSTQREDIEEDFVTEKGDTLMLSWDIVWISYPKLDTIK